MEISERKTSASAHNWQKIERVISSDKVVNNLHRLGKGMRRFEDNYREAGLAAVQVAGKLKTVLYPISETEDTVQLSHEIPDKKVLALLSSRSSEYLLDLHFHPRSGSRYKPYSLIPSYGDLLVETAGLQSLDRSNPITPEYFAIAQEQLDESIKVLVVKTPAEITARLVCVWPNDQTIREYEGFKEENVIEFLAQAGLEAMFLTIPPKQSRAKKRLNNMDLY